MNACKYVFAALLLGLWSVAAYFLLRSPTAGIHDEPTKQDESTKAVSPPVDPILKSKFDRIKVGMTLKEVEGIVGKAGPSLSSLESREVYIWKSSTGWIWVIVEQDKVTTKQFDPKLSIDN